MFKLLHALKTRFAFVEKITAIQSSMDTRYLIGAGVLILLAGMINYDTRQNQWEHWQANPNIFYAEGQPVVSTTDAGYFLSYANDYANDVKVDVFDSTRQYPERTTAFIRDVKNLPVQTDTPDAPRSAHNYPLLSVMIAELAALSFDGDLLTAANAMIPITGFLTAVVVGLMFWAAGYPAEGAIAGTGFGLSTSYLVRSSIGRIDTDQLIVFFVALTITFILLAIRSRDLRHMLAYILLAALSSMIFSWWYTQSIFVVLFPLMAGVGVFAARLDWRPALMAFGAFVIATNPIDYVLAIQTFAVTFVKKFFGISFSSAPTEIAAPVSTLSFPDTYTTITELARVDILATLQFMTSNTIIGVIGFFGFIVFMILRPSKGLVFLPFFMLGILSVFVGRRFAIYAAPFVWFGAAFAFVSLSRVAAVYLNKKGMAKNPLSFAKDGTVLVCSGIAVIFTAMISNIEYIPGPSFSSPVVHTMGQMRALNNQDEGVIATWWDYGYLAHYKSDMATLHDGGIQDSPRTHLLARGFISDNPDEMIQIIKFVGTEGNYGISEHSADLATLNTAIARADMPEKTPYILVTRQMSGWFTTIAKLGLFNTETGQYPSQQVLNGFHFYQFQCAPDEANKLRCREGLVDLNHGTLDGKPLIQKSVETLDGKIVNFMDYDNNGLYVLLISRNSNGGMTVKFIPRPTWKSAFTQLYELAVYDERRLELVIDNYPHARVYKILR